MSLGSLWPEDCPPNPTSRHRSPRQSPWGLPIHAPLAHRRSPSPDPGARHDSPTAVRDTIPAHQAATAPPSGHPFLRPRSPSPTSRDPTRTRTQCRLCALLFGRPNRPVGHVTTVTLPRRPPTPACQFAASAAPPAAHLGCPSVTLAQLRLHAPSAVRPAQPGRQRHGLAFPPCRPSHPEPPAGTWSPSGSTSVAVGAPAPRSTEISVCSVLPPRCVCVLWYLLHSSRAWPARVLGCYPENPRSPETRKFPAPGPPSQESVLDVERNAA